MLVVLMPFHLSYLVVYTSWYIGEILIMLRETSSDACVFFLWLLQERADIADKDDAKPLNLSGGSVEFDNVHFRWLTLLFVTINL